MSIFYFSLSGSEEYQGHDTCELHGEVRYPTGNECPEIYRALDGVRYIAECTKREEDSCKVTKSERTITKLLKKSLSKLSSFVSG